MSKKAWEKASTTLSLAFCGAVWGGGVAVSELLGITVIYRELSHSEFKRCLKQGWLKDLMVGG